MSQLPSQRSVPSLLLLMGSASGLLKIAEGRGVHIEAPKLDLT